MTRQSDTIRFFVNGIFFKLRSPPVTRTVLEFLREDAGLTGTKEGCAEGDCGACTAVVAELHDNGYRLRSVNACIQFLPTLDGKELITVEGLRNQELGLHPVQQAMVECHGSQCGFCTPGFVMSLFMLYRACADPTRAQIDAALSGNLCRCTGYRPIIDAARTMYSHAPTTDSALSDWKRVPAGGKRESALLPSEQALVERLQGIQRKAMLKIENGESWYAPLTLDTLADCVGLYPDATLLAGGTDVGLWVTKQHRVLPDIIYLGDVSELKSVQVTASFIEIGAGVTLADAFRVIGERIAGLDEIFRRFASPPICNAGTLVGNIANGSPIGDSMPALMCLHAEVVLRKGKSSRTVRLDEFYKGYRETALKQAEFVTHIRIPMPASGVVVRSYKLAKRFDQDISAVCGAFALKITDGVVERIDICFGGMAATPRRATMTETALLGEAWQADSIGRAVAALRKDFEPIDDMRATSGYRLQAAANLLELFFRDSTDDQPRQRVFDLREIAS